MWYKRHHLGWGRAWVNKFLDTSQYRPVIPSYWSAVWGIYYKWCCLLIIMEMIIITILASWIYIALFHSFFPPFNPHIQTWELLSIKCKHSQDTTTCKHSKPKSKYTSIHIVKNLHLVHYKVFIFSTILLQNTLKHCLLRYAFICVTKSILLAITTLDTLILFPLS